MAAIAARSSSTNVTLSRPTRERLEAERAGPREQVEDARVLHAIAQDREQRLAHAVRGRARAVALRGFEGPPSVGAGDHAHRAPRLGSRPMDPLAAVPVSTLCDVDKSLPVVDPGDPAADVRAALRAGLHGRRGGRVPLGAVGDRRGRAGRRPGRPGRRGAAGRARRAAGDRGLRAAAWAGSSSTATSAIAPGSRRSCRCGRAGRSRWRAAATSRRASAGRSCSAACA